MSVGRVSAIVMSAGLVAFVVGVGYLLTKSNVAPGDALAALGAQLAVTLPAAALVAAALTINVVAGMVVVRFVCGREFGRPALAVLCGLAGAMCLDIGLLAVLAPFGLFAWPALLTAQILVIAAGHRYLRSAFASFRVRAGIDRTMLPGAVLVILVWATPILLSLTSPVVPFFDVLPNHVAPVEHLRIFASLSSLDLSPSAAFGPSRILIGYEALLGYAAALTGVPAVTAVSVFAIALAVFVGTAVWGLATTIADRWAGLWALLVVPLTLSFARLPDGRGSVLVLPLVLVALWLTLKPLGSTRLRQSAVLALVLAAAIYVHPSQGAIAVVAVFAVAALLRADVRAVALAGAAAVVFAAPQILTMAGVSLPAWSILIAAGLSMITLLGGRQLLAGSWAANPRASRVLAIAVVSAALVVGCVAIVVAGVPAAVVAMILGAAASPVLLAAAVSTIPFGRTIFAYAALWIVAAAGFLVGLVAVALPTGSLVLDNIAYEVPKTTNYFAWPMVAIAAAVGLAGLVAKVEWPSLFRGVVAAVLLIALVAPLRVGSVDSLALGEHRVAETAATNIATAATGYWTFSPDSRLLIDPAEREILDAIGRECAAGNVNADTRFLHIAASFQPWNSVPLAIFDGVIETYATADAEHSIHTAGGRLYDLADVGTLADAGFDYVVLEPAGLPATFDASILDARFDPIFSNPRAIILRRRSAST